MTGRLGVVVIGRNEGERLTRCLASIREETARIVYVDSASEDGSPDRARSTGADVVALELDRPLTAARARNAGFQRLLELQPDTAWVQFVDGDCEIQPGWLPEARSYLASHPDVAVVCGRRRERHPSRSLYNRLTDLEWDTPAGDARACGGDAMMRVAALAEAGGYDAGLIAGEEPELCLRLRRRGHRVVRLGTEMTLHDAAMTRFGQWWNRQVRAGHAYAEGAWMHGGTSERFRVREVASIVAWALAVPLGALALAAPTSGVSVAAALLAYIALWRSARRARPGPDAGWWASACLIGKWAQLQGLATFVWNRALRRRRTTLIEYKDGSATAEGLPGPPPTAPR